MPMESSVGIIGGSGVYQLDFLNDLTHNSVSTRFGEVVYQEGRYKDKRVIFICRHGLGHSLPPHKINYRANIAALKKVGITHVVATNAVGGIDSNAEPGAFIIPDQLIDYSWGREHTFFDSFEQQLRHIDFSKPFNEEMRLRLIRCLRKLNIPCLAEACYACTQGPRLETAAEVKKLKADGCSVVGMTGMPEAALAKELDIAYASICFSVNWAAGVGTSEKIDLDEISLVLKRSSAKIQSVLKLFLE